MNTFSTSQNGNCRFCDDETGTGDWGTYIMQCNALDRKRMRHMGQYFFNLNEIYGKSVISNVLFLPNNTYIYTILYNLYAKPWHVTNLFFHFSSSSRIASSWKITKPRKIQYALS